jgi:hypothetical protein
MTDIIRFGDISGYDDAEVIEIQDDSELVLVFTEENSNENEQQDI